MPSIHNKMKKRRRMLRTQHDRCWICGKPFCGEKPTFDHVIPKSMGGGSGSHNLKLAHKECNFRRGRGMHVVFVEVDGIVALRWNVRSIGFI